MDLYKVILLGIIVSILSIFLKEVKPEYSLLCVIIGSIIIIFYILSSITQVLVFFDNIVQKTGINHGLYLSMLKIIGIGYLVEFGANVCRDSGNSSIAEKVILTGKIMIFLISIPVVSNLFEMVFELI